MKQRPSPRHFFLAALGLPLGIAGAQTVFQWNGTTDGTFGTPSNWTGGNVTPTGGNTNSRLNVNNTDPSRPLNFSGTAIYSGGSGRSLVIASGSNGSMVITGGTFDSRQGIEDVLVNNGWTGSLTIDGGSYTNVNGGSSIFLVALNGGAAGSPSLPTLNIDSGSFTTGSLQFGQTTGIAAGGINGIVNLNGGTLSMDFISEQGTTTTNGLSNSAQPITSTLNFNGGTLVARQDGTIMNVNAVDNAVVQANGAIIDTVNYNVTIAKGLTAGSPSGGFTKEGTGSLNLSGTNTYTGATSVTAGKLIVSGSLGNTAVTVSGAGTVLATDAAASFGSSVVIQSGSILAAGDAGVAGTATVTGATTFNNGSIFSWDINSTGASYDRLITSNVLGEAAPGNAVFRIVLSDATFANAFWNINRTWTNIFTTNGTTAISDWATIFGNSVQVVDSNFNAIAPAAGTFSINGSSLNWAAVPEPTTALAGLLLTAGLLRRQRA